MPKVVQTLWFDSLSPLQQSFIETPLGSLTPRQIIMIGFGSLLSYSFYVQILQKLSFIDQYVRIGLAATPFILSMIIALKKVKTIPPESYLYYFGRKLREWKPSNNPPQKSLEVHREIPREVAHVLSQIIPPIRAISTRLNPLGEVEVIGVLRNPKTGKPMPNTRLYAFIGNNIFSTFSDENGNYKVRFHPKTLGSYHMIIAAQGFDIPIDSILINVG